MLALHERFEAKVEPEPMSGCWIWMGCRVEPAKNRVNGHGYGLFQFNGRLGMAHRYAYETLVGPIPSGKVLDHSCRNRSCVNPQHLDVVTQQENLMRAPGSLAAINAAKMTCAHGHPFNDENTYFTPCGRRHCRACVQDNKRRFRQRQREGAAA